MSRTCSYRCDRCGSEITADRARIVVRCGTIRQTIPAADLCPGCQGDLRDFMAGAEAKRFELAAEPGTL